MITILPSHSVCSCSRVKGIVLALDWLALFDHWFGDNKQLRDFSLFQVMSVKLNNYCIMYYCSLIYEPCLHKGACLFISTVTSQNCSTSLEISLPYQTVYQYLLDNLVSRPLFVPTVIVVLHSSNSEHSSFMNLNTNCGSQSLITFWGIPISWKTQSQDILATFWAVMFILISI